MVSEAGTGVSYMYCSVCLFWTEERGCPKDPRDSISHVCSADEFLSVIPAAGQRPATGATSKLNSWSSGSENRYCQWVRFNQSSNYTDVYFTVKDGSGSCLAAGQSSLDVTIQGLGATCTGPRTVGGKRAGCDKGDQANECLWKFVVPKPGTPDFRCDCSKMIPAVSGQCPPLHAVLNVKHGGADRYNTSVAATQFCIPTFGYDNATNIYRISFCWSTSCPRLAPFAGQPMRLYVDQLPTSPATGPGRLANASVVFTHLHPECAQPTTTIKMANGETYLIGSVQQMRTVPAAGMDSVDIDVRSNATCNDEWIVFAIVPVHDIGGAAPPIPPASCPCWERTTNGTCPGIKVPILLETLDIEDGQSAMQCIDPANFDVYTGRMAYSYCWRYACLPDSFAATRFKATCSDLERWNIARMSGDFLLQMQRAEGLQMKVTGKPKNASLPQVLWTIHNDRTWVTLPEGGVGNLTFEYIIPPGFDDLSAAVVMDSSPRPPPPPSPPRPAGTTCACPLLPEQTVGGSPGQCNSTFATMSVTFANSSDGSTNLTQCVPWPNYDILLREMAWSHCWRYDCLPAEFFGKPYVLTIREVSKHNIALMPPARYELITLPAPYGMRINITLNPADGGEAMGFNSTVGGLVVGGRLQVVDVPALSNVTISYHIPAVFGVDGLAAAVMLRMIPGTQNPAPPRPPSPPPSPPSPPPLPVGTPQVLITTDFMVTASIPVESITGSNAGISHSGYYVTVPIAYYNYLTMPDCSDASTNAYKAQVAKTLGLAETSGITVSCRYATSAANQPISRRLLRGVAQLAMRAGLISGREAPRHDRRGLQSSSSSSAPLLDVYLTTATSDTSSNPSSVAENNCKLLEKIGGTCDASKNQVANLFRAQMAVAESAAAAGTGCEAAISKIAAEILAAAPEASKYDVNPTLCKQTPLSKAATPSAGSGAAAEDAVPSNSPASGGTGGAAPTPAAEGSSPGSASNGAAPAAAGSAASSAMSLGTIIGIVIGAVGGSVVLAVVVVTIKRSIDQRGHLAFVHPDNRMSPGARRWRTYSMQQQEEQARSGRGAIAGVSVYS
ncbi:hypothetical protein GPECTOR_16g599 [Gonium pectorale]|uniref:Pherophorin domain-containing protein n=1 Tax=Gonium pectorale TaxID=33097 RepID=A0A150GL17_GONPE|nr:hypothetical protein GPECTOR_16g599 [Gonium pectorale]|eukprot:KXZ50425.1 hypothetical protein GPECTOR_16g599 [Gonium pectorale]